MQFTKIVMAIALAAGASAAAVEKRGGSGGPSITCSSIAVCQSGGKTYCESPEPCKASGGSPYCCSTIGVLNLLNCVDLLDGNSVNLSIPLGVSIPISL